MITLVTRRTSLTFLTSKLKKLIEMSKIALEAKQNDTERVLKALPEIFWSGEHSENYSLKMGKTGDGTGKQSRYFVAYISGNGHVFCQYEESTMFEAANKAVGKLYGLK
jgi:hypothetical protein